MRYSKVTILGLLLITWLLLSGCTTNNSNLNEFFTPDKEWTEDIPIDADVISPEEFKRQVEAGELVIITPAILKAQEQATQKAYEENIAFLQGIPEKDPYITELLEEASLKPVYEADSSMVTSDGQKVTLLGLGVEINSEVESYKALHSEENTLDDYSLTYSLLPTNLKTQGATPESLKGKPLTEVQAALAKLDTLLGGLSSAALDGVRLETKAAILQDQALTINPGGGTDIAGTCTPTGLAGQLWFPLKNFVSPVKWQGGRGTCWAFAAIGAIESRERVQNDNPVNLSEQFFVNKVKGDWDHEDKKDGYQSEKALKEAADHNQALLEETGWTYNQSPNRSSTTNYANSCDGYSGDCSLSSHQSRRVCAKRTFGNNCGYVTYSFAGPGVGASRVTYLWRSGEDRFDLNRYRLLLSQGHVLLASFPVYRGFERPTNGFVTPYDKTHFTYDDKGNITGDSPGANGSHAVQIVGFISNDQLASTTVAPGDGGGYFIIKNSWGCGFGDAGYAYASAQYVDTRFTRLSVLNFDDKRSDAWNYDQAGGSLAPAIEIKANPARLDLRVSTNLADYFKVTHPVATGVTLSLTDTSDANKSIYQGGWTVRGGFPPTLPYTFVNPGRHVLTISATNKTNSVTATLNVDVVNSPPKIEFKTGASPSQGEAYPLSVIISDPNETDANNLCTKTAWSVDAPDTLASATGCQQSIKFGTTGNRNVRISVTDSDGLTSTQTLSLNVLPPPENPYPRILSSGVYSLEVFGKDCANLPVASNSTIDLRDKGCIGFTIDPNPLRYSAQVEVENPSSETLSYDWQIRVIESNLGDIPLRTATGSTSPEFILLTRGNIAEVTLNCYVTLKVNAPETSRSKGPIEVWRGKCTYYSGTVNQSI